MPWAIRRRILYLVGITIFFGIVVGLPLAYHFLSIAPTCHDGVQNQEETSPDHGGPCLLLDQASLQPFATLWARTFKVRSGLYDAVAYLDNPNVSAGAMRASFRFGLYDSRNILVAERMGEAFVMPGGITPVFIGGIDTGNRDAVRAYFEFTEPLIWQRASNVSRAISIANPSVSDEATTPRISAVATNQSVASVTDITFVGTVFDPAGNAIATSQTALPRLSPGESIQVTFTWPEPFISAVGRVDIIPVVAPLPDKSAQR